MQTETRQSIIAALPLFLIGLGISGGCFIAGGACYEIPSWRLYSGIAFGGLIALFTGITGLLALIKRIPDWSIIWIAISLIGALITINFASSFGLPSVLEVVLLIFSAAIGFTIFYFITKKSWQSAGLFGIGLSAALTLVLFFIATNISHDEIKIGYFDVIIGFVMSLLIYIYIKGDNPGKILILIAFVLLNSLMVFVFDMSMKDVNQESQLVYLIVFSNVLLFCGIGFHYILRLVARMKKEFHYKSQNP